eukprot:CAMPEP_0115506612 /NCGR_PEP_ID=MMETSP0271-20121206/71258_1 /TAXON_ID=71861 /ORGANISM="Scrippsiella trochoidea, Strain CCMP3099" /LENGTH=39 /DNA_ID= /DNA_START= /DNA_END= /DNA_ORIENTATION=
MTHRDDASLSDGDLVGGIGAVEDQLAAVTADRLPSMVGR